MTARADVVVLRTAAFPVSLLVETLARPDPAAAVREVFRRPEPRAALALASLEVLAALDRDEASDALDRSLLQYLIRMTTRPTPYGLFAAVATGSVGERTDLLVADVLRTSVHLAVDAVPRVGRTVRPTPTAYEVGGRIHYVEDHRRLVAAQPSPALRAALAHPGGDDLARDLAGELGVRESTAAAYVDELLAAGLLVDDPAVTGPAYDEQAGVAVPATGVWEQRLAETAALLGRTPSARLLVVDAVRDGRGLTIDTSLVRQLHRGVDIVRRLTPRRTPPALARFGRDLHARWPGRWMPLLHALDPDVGIGFGAVDTNGWTDPSAAAKLRLLTRALHDGRDEIELGPADLDELSVPDPAPLPQAYAVVARVDTAGDVHLRAVNGPPGSRLLGRFARADPALADALRRHHAAESARHPGAVVAEIAHLPAGRAGNVVSRPVLRDTEIVLLAAPGAVRTIAPADLYVGAVGGEVQLRLADGTRVLPRMATAHRYDGADLPLYRFFCELQSSDGGSLGWSWGPLEHAAYLPRVRAGDVVLAPRTWHRPRPADLPRWVVLLDDERELALDLQSTPCRDLLAARPDATVRELWPTPDRMAAHGSQSRYASELVVAFTQTGPVRSEPKIAMAVGPGPRHLPGGEWLSLKVYCGTSAADAILVAARPLLAGRDWWFIRYRDPDHHLRIRVRDGLDLLAGLHDLLDRPDVVRVQLDTYEPEVERYGGPDHIRAAEQLFAVDSRTLVDVLPLAADERWRLTFAAVDVLWGGADLSRIERVRDAYARELRFTADDRRTIGKRFRAERGALESVRNPLLDRRSGEIAPLLATLPDRVVPSLAHMTVNRWLRSRQREQEAVIYDLLVRLRRARQARRDTGARQALGEPPPRS